MFLELRSGDVPLIQIALDRHLSVSKHHRRDGERLEQSFKEDESRMGGLEVLIEKCKKLAQDINALELNYHEAMMIRIGLKFLASDHEKIAEQQELKGIVPKDTRARRGDVERLRKALDDQQALSVATG